MPKPDDDRSQPEPPPVRPPTLPPDFPDIPQNPSSELREHAPSSPHRHRRVRRRVVAAWRPTRKRSKQGVHDVTLPFRESSASLVDTATRVFRERAETKQPEFMGAAQTHVAKGAAMLSNAIELKLEDVIDRVPGGPEVRPLIVSTVQVALTSALDSLTQKWPRRRSR